MRSRKPRMVLIYILVVSVASVSNAQAGYSFDECKDRVLGFKNGSINHIGKVTSSNFGDFLYNGSVHGLNDGFPRQEYIAVTYQGCVEICGNPIQLNTAPQALSLASTWVFPLAILLSLPYDSLHKRKIRRTLEAVLKWLGSPQTALTATIFNVRQMRECFRQSNQVNGDTHRAREAYFILSCLNQFDFPLGVRRSRRRRDLEFVDAVLYGLFRPLAVRHANEPEVQYLQQLLSVLAFQLRMLRRRGVVPTLISLGTFLVAFVFSVVLAFADLGMDTTAFSLALGLLYSWLPLLVAFTIIDRNPVSADPRWLYNVNAVYQWKPTPAARREPAWWTDEDDIPEQYELGMFIGQGRRIRYNCLAYAVVQDLYRNKRTINLATGTMDVGACAVRVRGHLAGGRPISWVSINVASLLLVWTEVLMSVMIAFNAPTVGLGCRSLTYLLFGIFSTVSWIVQFWSRPHWTARRLSTVFNTLAVVDLAAIILFQLTGVFNNCYCKSASLGLPSYGGYMDFENAQFYKESFSVIPYWATATVIGGFIPLSALVTALFWWMDCKDIWKANEVHVEHRNGANSVRANLNWLR
ncbi:hypothetical protein QBC46DRAFT_320461 [Diplogelasinospora grovesii]|uniref:Uncharacterized protein n=1 Tax=Diplogelasinospora grovesii TaxID=303347 RepID=A0AAN6S1X4_9PEZI|nr:hypothetical protein QBC46DRAFT_320461 [Diplogelasinospora grovesii]